MMCFQNFHPIGATNVSTFKYKLTKWWWITCKQHYNYLCQGKYGTYVCIPNNMGACKLSEWNSLKILNC